MGMLPRGLSRLQWEVDRPTRRRVINEQPMRWRFQVALHDYSCRANLKLLPRIREVGQQLYTKNSRSDIRVALHDYSCRAFKLLPKFVARSRCVHGSCRTDFKISKSSFVTVSPCPLLVPYSSHSNSQRIAVANVSPPVSLSSSSSSSKSLFLQLTCSG
jgi:hypothetical protein